MIAEIILKKGREKSLHLRHPWLFSGAIAQIKGSPVSGDTVRVTDASGTFRGVGAFSAHSQIRVRMWSFDSDTSVDTAFFRERIAAAVLRRKRFSEQRAHTGYRLLNAESDGLPGLIVDRYGDWAVCQFLSAGVEPWKPAVTDALMEILPIRGVFERSDADVRALEGLPLVTGVLAGQPPPPRIEIQEGPCRLLVDVAVGHKTGFYLDQRDSRGAVAARCRGMMVLNCFSYTGAFAVHALTGGAAHVVNVDTSAAHLQMAEENLRINDIANDTATQVADDVFQRLRGFTLEKRRFDAIILDPPKFVDNKRHLMSASRGYKDINRLAAGLLAPGGLLFTFSCSGLMPADLFQKIVADAMIDARRPAQILARLGQAEDHPIATAFPEGAYLKGLICQMMD
ncbi:MAG: class I SAM-dependent methyltransferase [Pseudomonadota bacterium]